MEAKILLVEDEPAVASFILKSLREEGYELSIAPDGLLGLDMILNNSFDLVILDIMLPGINGIEICRKLRKTGATVPVLMLTALGTTENIVVGLDNGADDYLVKPFKLAELLARIRTLLRRRQTGDVPGEKMLNIADLFLSSAGKTVTRKGMPIDLTATEFRLLEYLLKNKKRVLSRIDILAEVWGVDFNMNTKVVDVYINYLRKKIDKGFEPKLIQTAVGLGYVIKEMYTDESSN